MREAAKSDAWRIAGAAVIVLTEIALIAALLIFLGARAAPLFVAFQMFSGITLIVLMGKSECDAYRTAWMGCVLVLGAAGVAMYLLFGRRHASRLARLSRENMQRAQLALRTQGSAPQANDEKVMHGLYKRGFPVFPAQECTYFPSGEAFWVSLLADIAQAQESIELEFFICCPGKILEKFLEMAEKAHERGVLIRLLIDDAGTMLKKDKLLRKWFEDAGIELRVFNPVARAAPLMTLNFRDHRKIAVIDGQIAYTGGINLADEYANLCEKYGHWKDTGVRLTGAAAGSFQTFFRALWTAADGQRVGEMALKMRQSAEGTGWVQPYQCAPCAAQCGQAPAMMALLIASTNRRLWITTPYLLLDDVLESALMLAAQSGVDVRIVLPGKPDHPLVAMAGEVHYAALLRGGVKLYRYLPGFMHAKMCLCDESLVSIGTVNLDFRSLFLHYEDGVLLKDVPAVDALREDMEAIFERCEEVKLQTVLQASPLRRLMRLLLRAAAPLM